ncbi:MAG: alanine racemase, partial [Lysobacterales bacterium]
NIDREEQKSGSLPEEIPRLAQVASSLHQLRMRGLMAIPRALAGKAETLQSFRRMHQLFCQLRDEGITVDTLSMGMSADFELAILAGSTMVRVGTGLFGPRRKRESGNTQKVSSREAP